MNLSYVIQQEEYWHHRLADQWRAYRRARRIAKPYHRQYCRKIIVNIRQWRAEYRARCCPAA